MTLTSRRHQGRFPLGLLLALTLTVLLPSTGFALITQSFKTTDPVVIGSLVSLSNSAPNTIRAATRLNVSALYGVVTGITNGTAQVATSELVSTLVSNGNGDIAVGSPITASDVKGVGQRATASTRIIGFAQATFTAKTPSATTQTVTDASGHAHKLAFGGIPVVLGAGNYVASAGTTPTGTNADAAWLPTSVQTFFASIAGHQVVPSRIVLSLFLLCVVVVVIGVIIGTAVHGSVISIGRNPLASRSLLKALGQVVFVVVMLMAGAVGAVYFIVSH